MPALCGRDLLAQSTDDLERLSRPLPNSLACDGLIRAAVERDLAGKREVVQRLRDWIEPELGSAD
jgi:hypothetical protein